MYLPTQLRRCIKKSITITRKGYLSQIKTINGLEKNCKIFVLPFSPVTHKTLSPSLSDYEHFYPVIWHKVEICLKSFMSAASLSFRKSIFLSPQLLKAHSLICSYTQTDRNRDAVLTNI